MLKRFGIISIFSLTVLLMEIPINIARATYFVDKVRVEVMRQDSKYSQMYVTKTSFLNERQLHTGLKLLDGTTIPEDTIASVILVHSPFTTDSPN